MKETFYRFDTPVKVCLLADIHNDPFDEITASLKKQRPDIIAVAGDILGTVNRNTDQPIILQPQFSLDFLKTCAQYAPTFFSLGNHEWMLSKKDLEIIRNTGTVVLDNEYITHGELCIGGLSSSGFTAYKQFRSGKEKVYPEWNYFNAPQRSEPDTDWLDSFEKQRGYKILLSHHPEYYPVYLKGRKIDLVLSGHAHGGQIRLFGRGLFAPGQGVLPKYTSGTHGKMIITRGLANTGKPIPRLFNRREIVYIAQK